ncbi:hypothetical protein GCM10009090_19850 [[Pseudomonas] boreopolis]|uniref:Uncharacterized protein n=1 Tax=Xanthomonas boreopolis TaxID=86183 RepID=A0A919KHU3_9XANT|nr:hypothetical protein GCM10009090_19850 [[Pseudomonas] boreopolis]
MLRVRGANEIFGRDILPRPKTAHSSAMRTSPGHSPRGECPPAGAKQCFAFSGEPMCAALRVFPIVSAASEGPRRSDIRRPWRWARRRARKRYPAQSKTASNSNNCNCTLNRSGNRHSSSDPSAVVPAKAGTQCLGFSPAKPSGSGYAGTPDEVTPAEPPRGRKVPEAGQIVAIRVPAQAARG